MLVTVRCFARLRELSVDRARLEVPAGATVEDVWAELVGRHPALAEHRPYIRAARNAVDVAWDTELHADDVVAFLPPVSGGATSGLSERPIDVEGLERSVASRGHGAVVTFVGRARDRSDAGREVVELEYEVYPEMAEATLAEIADEAERRWPVSVAVRHRYGVVPIGEAAVAIAVGAAHRDEAYAANRFVIEAIKERLPIWKRERFPDGSEWKRRGA